MSRTTRFAVLLFAAACAVAATAQDDARPPEPDARLQPDQRVETDTAVGRFSVGVSGITESERDQATTGDVELGRLFQVETDGVFPRVFELQPFVFNRVESSESAAFESLGLGAGVRASVRKQYAERNWFVRLSMLTPTDYYREVYSPEEDFDSIVEVFAGYEVPLTPGPTDRAMRRRMAGPHVIDLRVPAPWLEAGHAVDADERRRRNAGLLARYLTRVYLHSGAPLVLRQGRYPGAPALALIEHVTGEGLTQTQAVYLEQDVEGDRAERLARRKQIVEDQLGRGLIAMMRGGYPLVFVPVGTEAEQDQTAGGLVSVARVSRPGTHRDAAGRPLDSDALIADYIALVCEQLR